MCLPSVCTLQFRPVCGSDGNTYPNECALNATACERSQIITVSRQGECKQNNEGESSTVFFQFCVLLLWRGFVRLQNESLCGTHFPVMVMHKVWHRGKICLLSSFFFSMSIISPRNPLVTRLPSICWLIRNRKLVLCFCQKHEWKLGEREMRGTRSTAFSSSPKLSRVFLLNNNY